MSDTYISEQAARRILRESKLSDDAIARVLALLPVQRFDDRPYYILPDYGGLSPGQGGLGKG